MFFYSGCDLAKQTTADVVIAFGITGGGCVHMTAGAGERKSLDEDQCANILAHVTCIQNKPCAGKWTKY